MEKKQKSRRLRYFTIKEPLFSSQILVVIGDRALAEKVISKFTHDTDLHTIPCGWCGMASQILYNDYPVGEYIIWVEEPPASAYWISVLAHEATHVSRLMQEHVECNEHEFQARAVEWIMCKVLETCRKRNIT
jgi:hypothetical protein